MSTSGSYSFAVSRDDIIRQALLNIGKLDETESPTPIETNDCARMLNMLVKQWQGRTDFAPGLKTWTRRHGHLFLSNVTGQYTIGPSGSANWTNSYLQTTTTASANLGANTFNVAQISGSNPTILVNDKIGIQLSNGALYWSTVNAYTYPTVTIAGTLPASANYGAAVFDYNTVAQQPVYIETAFLRDINNEDTPLRRLTVEEYDILPSKTDTTAISDPTAIYYEFQLTNSVLFTDVPGAQDVSKHICMSYLEAVQDFVNPTDNPSYPQEWYLALVWGLTKNIAPSYKVPFTADMQAAYAEAVSNAREKEPERSVLFFMPGEDGT